MSLNDARARLKAHFASDDDDVFSTHTKKWSELWDKGDFLPWDRGVPNPALVDLLLASRDGDLDCVGTSTYLVDDDGHDGNDVVDVDVGGDSSGDGNEAEAGGKGRERRVRGRRRRRKKALVPGCGRGYDVLLLAGFGYDALGLEVSEGAVRRCWEEWEKEKGRGKGEGGMYAVRDEEGVGAGEVRFVRGDFFAGEGEWMGDGEGGFDLIYDYTFLSALPPSLRPRWALRMAQLLAPKGSLICVEFPSAKDPLLGGPPFALPPQVYTEHLAHPGKEIPYDEKGHVKEGVSGPKGPDALTRVAHWQPERTHEIGKGQDWVSIWHH